LDIGDDRGSSHQSVWLRHRLHYGGSAPSHDDYPDYLYAVDQSGEIVAGGPDSIGVSDNQDAGELLQEVVNNVASADVSLRLSSEGKCFEFKSKASLDYVVSLFGGGKNRIQLATGTGFNGGTAGGRMIKIVDLATTGDNSAFILRFDSIKFDGADGSGPRPDKLLYFDGVHEVI